ncbi:MAG: DEAD/DEAH box helicase [Brachybacterium sp.]|uniref:Lhr family helicase n=1 Tax=Brachybacterium sp. TaxID=1891286 RepID=UPI0026478647|nr:DEAD/DEAH box helicase [Brachybacterium sp.]MDN5688361.1 DEAD/DEAH box helicase [Brachybacterium sp.]
MSTSPAAALPTSLHPATRDWFSRELGLPTPVQLGAWQAISDGEDALVIAPTGSGKTLAAFLRALDDLMFTPEISGAPGSPAAAGSSASDDARDGARPEQRPGERTRVLYISPMKALGVDVERNLRRPLAGIPDHAAARGDEAAPVRVGVRSGDTTPAERRRLISHPPDILITTPESLFLMLTSAARETLADVETVIVDEVHAIAGGKRGVHLALSLARLDALITGAGPAPTRRRPQRLGLSATVEPPEEVARFLSPTGRAARVVAPAGTKRWDLGVTVPVRDMDDVVPPSDAIDDEDVEGTLWPHVERAVLAEVEAHRSTIVFSNSRRQAERLTDRLNALHRRRGPAPAPSPEEVGEDTAVVSDTDEDSAGATESSAVAAGAAEIARVHHGSMSKEARRQTEDLLKAGVLRCVVATSTLELGIDMGAVDAVVQVSSPFDVASLLQRVGRAGHGVGDVSRGRLHPLHPLDAVHSALLVREARAGRLEPLEVPRNALDVLAQHTLSAAALEELEVEGWLEVVRSAAPYAELPRSAFDSVLDMLSGRYPSTAFSELRPRVVHDRSRGVLGARPGVQRLVVTNAGTIPDRGLFPVFLAAGAEQARRVGELDEEMVYESRRGDVITLGTSSWRIEEITHERVTVSPAPGFSGRIPFWHGDGAMRPATLGRAIGAYLDQIAGQDASERERDLVELGLDEDARAQVHLLLERQLQSTGVVPGDSRLVLERFVDDLGDWRIVVHCPLGRRVTAPWALAISDRLREAGTTQVQVVASDDGIVLRLPQGSAAPTAQLVLFSSEVIEQTVQHLVGSSALFAARFRECSARALLLPRRVPTSRAPLWQQRQRSATLLDAARDHADFPMMLEAARECLLDEYDLPALTRLLSELETGRVEVVEVDVDQPSPIARAVMFGYEGQFIYDADAPLAERRTAALTLDQSVLAELLGTVSLRELLMPAAIAQVSADAQLLSPERAIRDGEDLADALRRLGPLTPAQVLARFGPADGVVDPDAARTAIAQLTDSGRVLPLHWHEEDHLALVEEVGLWRDAAGDQVLPRGAEASLDPAVLGQVPDAAEQAVARWARCRGPFTVEELIEDLPLPPATARAALAELSARRVLAKGAFLPGRESEEWVDAGILRRIRRVSLAAARQDIAPVSPEAFTAFTLDWHGIGEVADGRGVADGPGAGDGREAADGRGAADERAAAPHGIVGAEDPDEAAEALADVVDQLTGVEAPLDVWREDLLPVRLGPSAPRLLEDALGRGEVLVTARGSGSTEPMVRLHLADALALGLDREQLEGTRSALAADSLAHQVLEALEDAVGPVRLQDLAAAVRRRREEESLSLAQVADALQQLALAGLATPDSLAALPGRSSSARSTPAPRRRGGSASRRGRRGAARLSASLLRAETEDSALASLTGPAALGRWSAVRVPAVDPSARRAARVALLVDRYGLLTRGAVANEGVPGGWSSVFRELADLEDSGAVRRGYFVEGLGAAQFAQTAAVDRLRAAPGQDRAVVLSVIDPASPFGTVLPWPESDSGSRPQRRAGAHVVVTAGRAAAYLESGGKSLLWWSPTEVDVEEGVASALASAAATGRLGRVSLERIDGLALTTAEAEQPASMRRAVQALQRAGFTRSPRSLRFHGR